MTSKDLMIRVVRMFSGHPHKSYQEIAGVLSNDNPPIPTTPADASKMVREGCAWLLREQETLDQIRRREIVSGELQAALREKYPLVGAKVLRCAPIKNPEDYRNLERVMGQVAAEYFDELLEFLEHRKETTEIVDVILSGGESVLDMVTSLAEIPRPIVNFHPAALIGRGRMLQSTHIGPETTATIAWSKSGRNSGRLNYATVSPDESGFRGYGDDDPDKIDPETHRHRLEEIQKCLRLMSGTEAVRHVVQDLSQANFAVVTIGLLDPPIAEDADRFSMIGLIKGLGLSRRLLAKDGAIGDISYCLMDRGGGSKPEWNLFHTPGFPKKTAVEFYRDMVERGELVMVIAGTRKEELLRAALNGKLINILITDEHTARTLLKDP